VFCPTQDMIADFFTKPLQGGLFVRMREKILNLPASEVATVHRSVLKDRRTERRDVAGHTNNARGKLNHEIK